MLCFVFLRSIFLFVLFVLYGGVMGISLDLKEFRLLYAGVFFSRLLFLCTMRKFIGVFYCSGTFYVLNCCALSPPVLLAANVYLACFNVWWGFFTAIEVFSSLCDEET